MNMKNKRGLSPVIATVLLIAIVVVIALIIFMWLRGITEESITKFGNKNIKLVCGDVSFEAEYNNEKLSISNTGSVPIYNINLRIIKPGSHITDNLKDPLVITVVTDWPSYGLNQGESFSSTLQNIGTPQELVLIPILIGTSKKGEEIYECEDSYGFKINV